MRTKELGSEILLTWVCTKWCALNQDIYGNNVLVSNKMPSYEENYKQITSYLHDHYKIKTLHIMLPKARAYSNSYVGQTKCMYFWIKDKNLLKKYNALCNEVSIDIKPDLIVNLSTVKIFENQNKILR